jgi:hypothetical protein
VGSFFVGAMPVTGLNCMHRIPEVLQLKLSKTKKRNATIDCTLALTAFFLSEER